MRLGRRCLPQRVRDADVELRVGTKNLSTPRFNGEKPSYAQKFKPLVYLSLLMQAIQEKGSCSRLRKVSTATRQVPQTTAEVHRRRGPCVWQRRKHLPESVPTQRRDLLVRRLFMTNRLPTLVKFEK